MLDFKSSIIHIFTVNGKIIGQYVKASTLLWWNSRYRHSNKYQIIEIMFRRAINENKWRYIVIKDLLYIYINTYKIKILLIINYCIW